jgi:hypothetical protein
MIDVQTTAKVQGETDLFTARTEIVRSLQLKSPWCDVESEETLERIRPKRGPMGGTREHKTDRAFNISIAGQVPISSTTRTLSE